MKASTKAEKLRRKRGRPILPEQSRENSGRPSRRKASMDMRQAMTEQEARSVAVDRRIRQDNILPFCERGGKVVSAEEQAIDPRRGYVLGLMYLDHTITARQHEAGLRFAEDFSRYLGLCNIGFPSARAQNLFAVRGHDGEETEALAEQTRNAQHKAKLLRDAILATGPITEGRHILNAVKEVALLDNAQARRWPDHMLLLVRRGLNKLADHYGIN